MGSISNYNKPESRMSNTKNSWFSSIITQVGLIEQSHERWSVPEVEPLTRAEKYWLDRNDSIPVDRVCPVCHRTLLKSRQWVPPVCKSCFMTVTPKGGFPKLTLEPHGTKRVWFPDGRTTRELAEAYGVTATTIHRWLESGEIPCYAVKSFTRTGPLVVTHMRVSPIEVIPIAFGVSGRTFGEMIGCKRWKSGLLPVRSWSELIAHVKRLSL